MVDFDCVFGSELSIAFMFFFMRLKFPNKESHKESPKVGQFNVIGGILGGYQIVRLKKRIFSINIKTLSKNNGLRSSVVQRFEKHVEKIEKKLDKNKDEEKYQHYIINLFKSFCPIFFSSSTCDKNIFPEKWNYC